MGPANPHGARSFLNGDVCQERSLFETRPRKADVLARVAQPREVNHMRRNDWSSEAKDAARKGLDEQAANRTVALYVVGKGQEKVENGTGICLSYRSQFFIATAAHLNERWGETNAALGAPRPWC